MDKINDITLLLQAAETGAKPALNALIDHVHPELIKISAGIRRKQFNVSQSLDTIALVNETWIKLERYGIKAKNRKHFYRMIAKMMRQILINNAKKKCAKKNASEMITFMDDISHNHTELQWLIQLDDLLNALEKQSQRLSDIFHLRYFLGLTEQETAESLALSERTIRREWLIAKKIVKETI